MDSPHFPELQKWSLTIWYSLISYLENMFSLVGDPPPRTEAASSIPQQLCGIYFGDIYSYKSRISKSSFHEENFAYQIILQIWKWQMINVKNPWLKKNTLNQIFPHQKSKVYSSTRLSYTREYFAQCKSLVQDLNSCPRVHFLWR